MFPERFLVILDRVRRLLAEHEVRYGSVIGEWMTNYIDHPSLLRQKVRSQFSGMGGLNDIVICKENGHRVEHERETNLELRALLYVLWAEVEDPVQDAIPVRAMHLVKVFPKSHEEAEVYLARDDLETIYDVLVWVTYRDDDWAWVQKWCLSFTYHENPAVRSLAASCLADLATLHKTLDAGVVLSRLGELLNDPDVEESAEHALMEINSTLMRAH